MADEEKKGEAAAPQPARSRSGALGPALMVALSAVSAAAGSAFGPQLRTYFHVGAAAKSAEAEEPLPAETGALEPFIVDILDVAEGKMHHIRAGLALEFAHKFKEEDEFKKIAPRARDASIEFLRSLSYEDATNRDKYEKIKTDLTERIGIAVGKSRIKRVLITEFIVQ